MTRLDRHLVATAGLALAGAAHAQTSPRTFVATTGTDANTATLCGRATPCRSFASALSVTGPQGEVVVLDSGGYGPVAIRQGVTITAPEGVHAAVTQTSTAEAAITIDTTEAVTVRGLHLSGLLSGRTGILVRAALEVLIDRCAIQQFSEVGIHVAPKDTFALQHEVTVNDTLVRFASIGIRARGRAGEGRPSELRVDRSRFEIGARGIVVEDAVVSISRSTFVRQVFSGIEINHELGRAAIADSVLSQNSRGLSVVLGQATLTGSSVDASSEGGIVVSSAGALSADRVELHGNPVGLEVAGTGTALLSRSVVTGNERGLRISPPARLLTRGDNVVVLNDADVEGVLTPTGAF